MNYTIRFSDPDKAAFSVSPYTTDGTAAPSAALPLHPLAVRASTSLVLVGKGVVDYGAVIQNNVVYVTENFANATAPVYPMEGQEWFDNTPASKRLMVYNGSSWDQVLVNGKFTTAMNATNQRISNVGTPTAGQDAVTKDYADDTFVRVDGATPMTGPLTLPGNPTNPLEAVTKQYLDDALASISLGNMGPVIEYLDNALLLKLDLAGGIITGDVTFDTATLTMSGGNILVNGGAIVLSGETAAFDGGGTPLTNIGSPVNNSDAATRIYVDTKVSASAIIAGNVDPTTGVITLNTATDPLELIGAAAPFEHDHADVNVRVAVAEDGPSAIREFVGLTKPFEEETVNLTLTTVVRSLDQSVNRALYRNRRHVAVGTGSATITLPFKFPVEMNKLSVYKNGVKMYRDERAIATLVPSTASTLASDTGLSASAYYFNLNVDGTPNTDVPVDLSAEITPITYSKLTYALKKSLNISGYQTVTFTVGLVDGTESTGLAASSYATTVVVDGESVYIEIEDGSTVPTINDLLGVLSNALIDQTGVASSVEINAGKIRITSALLGTTSTVAITDAAGPTPGPLFSSLTNFSAIDAATAGTSIASVEFTDGRIQILSPTAGNGSQVTATAPSTGTNLLTSITTVTVNNQTISTTYDYYEVGEPLRESTQITFPGVTNGADKYEYIVEPYFVPRR